MIGPNSPVHARLKRLNDGRLRACCGRSGPDCPGELGYLVTELKMTNVKTDELPFKSEHEWWQQHEEMAGRSWKRGGESLDPPDRSLLHRQMTQPFFLAEMLGEVRPGYPGEWIISNPAGLRPIGDGAFAVIRGRRAEDGTRVGRRRVPDDLSVNTRHPLAAHVQQWLIGSGPRGIIGQIPSLPAVVVCPVCGLYNEVAPPH